MKIDIHQGQLGTMAYIIIDGISEHIKEELAKIQQWLSENMPNGGFRCEKLKIIEEEAEIKLSQFVSEYPFIIIFDTDEHAVLFKVWMDD